MPVNLLNLIKNAITPDIVSKLSGLIGESSTNTQSAITSTIPALLGGLINKTSSESGADDVMKLVKEGGYNGNMLNNLGSTLNDSSSLNNIINNSSNSLNSLFGEKLGNITNLISKSSGVSSKSASSILGFLASVVMSFLGKQISSGNLNAQGLMGLISDQKGFLAGLIPTELASLLGLTGLEKVSSTIKDSTGKTEDIPSSGIKKFLPWLLAALAAILLLWWWRGCEKDTTSVTKKVDSAKTDNTKKIETAIVTAPKTNDPVMDSLYATLGKFTNRKLTDGTEIIIAEKGVEFNLIAFIEDKTKMADKETWFSFDRILFETNKAALRPSSGLQLANIAAIMKSYPNVEIKIGGYTDNTGNANANMKLSQERANSVMSELVKLGVPTSRMKAEGYGNQFPVASNDTPEGRQKNRRVDVRVSKK